MRIDKYLLNQLDFLKLEVLLLNFVEKDMLRWIIKVVSRQRKSI